MLALSYRKYQELYNSYGCYLKPVSIVEYRNQMKIKKQAQGMLPFEYSNSIHDALKRMAGPSGTLQRPQEVAAFLQNLNVPLQYNKKLDVAVDKMSIKDKVHLSRVSSGGISDLEQLHILLEIKHLAQRQELTNSGKLFLVLIDDAPFDKVLPAYMKQLCQCMTVINIPVYKYKVDYTNTHFKMVFKNWLVPNEKGILPTQHAVSSDKYVIANLTPLSDDFIRSKNPNVKLSFVKMRSTLVKVKTLTGDAKVIIGTDVERVKLEISENKSRFNHKKEQFGAITDITFNMGRVQGGATSGIGLDSKILQVTAVPVAFMSDQAHAFIYKVLNRIYDPANTYVNIILIGNKGSGKSRLSAMIATWLSRVSGSQVDVFNSDSYGIWRNQLLAWENQQIPDLYLVKRLNEDAETVEGKASSIYHQRAKEILDSYKTGITTVEQYLKLPFSRREKLINELKVILFEYAKSDVLNGEFEFYDRLASSKDRSRITIYESHHPLLDADMPRSELTFRILPVWDTRLAVINRDNNPVDLLLHDTYMAFDSLGHVGTYPSDWVSLMRRVVGAD